MVVATVSGVKASFKLNNWEGAVSPLAQQKMEELLPVLAVDGFGADGRDSSEILTILRPATGTIE
jgi:hypothetical protein